MIIEEQICNWIYKIDFEKKVFSIIPNVPMQVPLFLNKYYPLNDNSIAALYNSFFFVNHPEDFNDPFEYHILQLNNDCIDFFRSIGLISFSKDELNQLMWAHYCNHNGFVLKFETDYLKSLFQGPFPMNYQENIPDFSRIKNKALKLFFNTNLKPYDWKYENEFRFIHVSDKELSLPNHGNYDTINANIPASNRFKGYDKNRIIEIIIGYKFFIEEKGVFIDGVLTFMTKSQSKHSFLKFIIENNLSTYVIDIESSSPTFCLKKEKASISYSRIVDLKENVREYKMSIIKN